MAPQKVIKSSMRKTLYLLFVSAVFVAVGIWMIVAGENITIGWLCVVFFGLGIPLSIWMLISPVQVMLTEEGFVVKSLWGRNFKCAWKDVDHFYIYKQSAASLVGIVFSSTYHKQEIGRSIAKSVSGHEAALPNGLTVSSEKLCELMEDWRQRYTTPQ